jgi:hypothetical protein
LPSETTRSRVAQFVFEIVVLDFVRDNVLHACMSTSLRVRRRCEHESDCTMRWHEGSVRRIGCGWPQILFRPQIPKDYWGARRDPHVRNCQGHVDRCGTTIEQQRANSPTCHLLPVYLPAVVGLTVGDHPPLEPECILIDCDQFDRSQNSDGLWARCVQVSPNQQWGSEKVQSAKCDLPSVSVMPTLPT